MMQTRWYLISGVFIVIAIAFFILIAGTGERSISNYYILPVGEIHVTPGESVLKPAPSSLKQFVSGVGANCSIDINPVGGTGAEGELAIRGLTTAAAGNDVTLVIRGDCSNRMPFTCSEGSDFSQPPGNSVCCWWTARTNVVRGTVAGNSWMVKIHKNDPNYLSGGNYSIQARIGDDCVSGMAVFRIH